MQKINLNPAKLIPILLLGLFLFLDFPNHILDRLHDYPSQQLMQFYLRSGFIWGKDFIQNVGPFSYLSYPKIYTGYYVWQSIILSLFLIVIFLYILVKRNDRLAIVSLYLVSLSIFAYGDVKFYIFIFVLVSLVDSWQENTLVAILMAVLTLAKSTLLFISVFYIFGYATLMFFSQRNLKSFLPFIVYLSILFLGWYVSGQPLETLYKFIYSLKFFISGYTESLVINESQPLFFLGLASVILCAFIIIKLPIFCADNKVMGVFKKVVLFAILIIVFKHSFIRADTHILALPFFVISVFITYVYLLSSKSLLEVRSFSVLILSVTVAFVSVPISSAYVPLEKHIQGRFVELITNGKSIINPITSIKTLSNELNSFVKSPDIEQFSNLISGDSFTYFGYRPYMVPFVNGKFCTTYSTISFAGWNSYIDYHDLNSIIECNPKYIIYDISTIDWIIPGSNSPLLQSYLYANYTIVAVSSDHLILRKNLISVFEPSIILSDSKGFAVRNNEIIQVGDANFLQADINLIFLDNIYEKLYKPYLYKMCIEYESGDNECFKITKERLSQGFNFDKLPKSNDALISDKYKIPMRLWFECFSVFGRCSSTYEGKLAKHYVPNLLSAKPITFIDTNHSVNTMFEGSFSPRYVGSKLLLHAPIDFYIHLHNAEEINFDYGMLETSYSNGGSTDGVEVSIFVTKGSSEHLVKKLYINPNNVVERDERTLKLKISNGSDRLIIKVRSLGKPMQDHFYIEQLRLKI